MVRFAFPSRKAYLADMSRSTGSPTATPRKQPDHCPDPAVVRAFLLLQERWVLFIVHALLAEPGLGFNELSRRATGVNPATLKQRLDLLEREGVLAKRVVSTMPPRTEYRLTPTGDGLRPVLDAIEAWGVTRPSPPNPAAK